MTKEMANEATKVQRVSGLTAATSSRRRRLRVSDAADEAIVAKGDDDGAFRVLRGASAHHDHGGGLVGRLEARLACGSLSSTAWL
jgi:hypothetical protein